MTPCNRSLLKLASVTVATLVTLAVADAKKPDNPGGGGGGGDDSPLVDLHPAGTLESEAYDINDAGLVVGWVDGIPAAWDVSETVPGFLFLMGGAGGALAVNAAGEIVGHGDGSPRYWADVVSDPVDLPLPEEANFGVANGISDDGIIVGEYNAGGGTSWWAVAWSVTGTDVFGPVVLGEGGANDVATLAPGLNRAVGRTPDFFSGRVATAWDLVSLPDGSFDVVDSFVLAPQLTSENFAEAYAINNLGDITGTGAVQGGNAAFLIRGETLTVLPTSGRTKYGAGFALNDAVVVGETAPSWLTETKDAALWNSRNRQQDLPRDYFNADWGSTSARGINAAGEIVGLGGGRAWLLRAN